MRIRVATPDDAPAIARVHVDTWRSTYRGTVPDAYLDGLNYESRAERWRVGLMAPAPHGCVFVAEDEAGVFGFANCGTRREGPEEYTGEIQEIYVLQDRQRSGAGRALAQACAEHLVAEGMTSMLILALKENPYRAFYERLGGVLVYEGSFTLAGQELQEVGYGWADIRTLLEERSR